MRRNTINLASNVVLGFITLAIKVLNPIGDVMSAQKEKSANIYKSDTCGSLAEREGFEPPVPCSTPVFKTGAFDHSAISPKEKGCEWNHP